MRPATRLLQQRSSRLALAVVCAISLLLVAVVALAKGQVNVALSSTSPGTAETTATSSGDFSASPWAAFRDRVAVCQPPTPSECVDPAYALTPCGKAQVGEIWSGGDSHCEATCVAGLAALDAATCRDEAWLNSICGQREQVLMEIEDNPPCTESCPQTHPSTCVNLIRADEEAAQSGPDSSVAPGLPQQEVVIPTDDPPFGDPYNPVVDGYNAPVLTKRTVAVNDDSTASLFSDGTGRHYWSTGNGETIVMSGGAVQALTQAVITTRQERWDANAEAVGDAFDSCREYIFEKYYDYSMFEKESRSRGDSFRDRFLVAFDGNQPWAIGTRGEAGIPLRRRDGVPNDADVEFPPGHQQKNTMFNVEVFDTITARTAAFNRWEGNQHVIQFGGGDVRVSATIERPFSLNEVYIVNDDIDAALREGRANHTYVESWGWHHQTGDALLGDYLDEELHAVERLKERMAFLLHQRAGLVDTYKAILRDMYGFGDVPAEYAEQGVFDPGIYEHSDPYSQFFAAQDSMDDARAAAVGMDVSSGLSLNNLGAALNVAAAVEETMTARSGPAPVGTQFTLGAAIAQQGLTLLSAASSEFSNEITLTSPAYSLVKSALDAALALVAQDAKIEALLEAAARRGCLSLPGDPDFAHNPCDWSPRFFAQRVEDPFMRAREREYERCLAYTGDFGFSRVVDPPPAGAGSQLFYVDVSAPALGFPGYSEVRDVNGQVRPCSDEAFNQNTDQVERYFKCQDRFRNDLLEALDEALEGDGVVIDPETGKISLSESTSDSDKFGNSTFNLNYDYEARWSLMDLPTNTDQGFVCTLKPHLHGHFNAGARVLVADVSIINATADIGLDPGQAAPNAHLEILGNELIGVDEPHFSDSHKFNVISEPVVERGGKIFSIGATFVIVVVPVSLKGGMAGRVGARFEIGAGSGGAAGQDCNDGGMLLRASVEPYAGLDAFASVSIDAVIVEAGVKITVTIIEVSFPFTTDLSFVGAVANNTLEVRMHGETSLDVVFKFLGGKFSAYLEVCFIFCEEFEETLFSWSPLVLKKRLLSTSFDVPLNVLLTVPGVR